MSSLINGAWIYQGPWVDWSRGLILGGTITLSARKGAVVTSFLAFFVTVVGACLWRITCYILHQISASPHAKDGLHHQHQLLLRNTSAPSEAIRTFAESGFVWRKTGRRAWTRSLPLAIFAVIFMLGFGAASILTALITKAAGSGRLIVSDHCGVWALDDMGKASQTAMNTKDLADTVTAASYARACYGSENETNALQCIMYAKKALPFSVNEEVECPFGDNICNATAYQLDTHRLSSHNDFGINTPRRGRVDFRKVTTCAPLKQEGYVEVTTSDGTTLGAKGDRIRHYQYGAVVGAAGLPNDTWRMNQHAFVDNWGYQLEATVHQPNSTRGWIPIPALDRNDADTTIMFLAPNAIQFDEPNNDPFFHANLKVAEDILGLDQSFYVSDEWAYVMACTDQYQLCNPLSPETCTPLSSYYQVYENVHLLGLNALQETIADILILNLRTTTTYHSIGNRGASALLAQEKVNLLAQAPIPDTQWHLEVRSWFVTSLARLQRSLTSYAAGPEHVTQGSHIEPPPGPISRSLCYAQKVNLTMNTVSFSILGIAVTLSVGVFIILVYLVLDIIVSAIQKRYNWGDYRRLRWIMDDKMQVQRMMFEEAGMGTWENLTGNIPVTVATEEFGGLGHVDPNLPRLSGKWTGTDEKRASKGSLGRSHEGSAVDLNGELNQMLYVDAVPAKDRVSVYQKPVYQALTPPSGSQSRFMEQG